MSEPKNEYVDPYASKVTFGNMVRAAAGMRIDEDDALNRAMSITACEKFMTALVESGCMINRIPTGPGGDKAQAWADGYTAGWDAAEAREHWRTVLKPLGAPVPQQPANPYPCAPEATHRFVPE